MDDCCSYTALGDEAWVAFARIAAPGVYAEKARGPGFLSGRPLRRAGERYLARAPSRAGVRPGRRPRTGER